MLKVNDVLALEEIFQVRLMGQIKKRRSAKREYDDMPDLRLQTFHDIKEGLIADNPIFVFQRIYYGDQFLGFGLQAYFIDEMFERLPKYLTTTIKSEHPLIAQEFYKPRRQAIDKQQLQAKLDELNLEAMTNPKNRRDKFIVRCLFCGNVRDNTINNIMRLRSGCPHCHSGLENRLPSVDDWDQFGLHQAVRYSTRRGERKAFFVGGLVLKFNWYELEKLQDWFEASIESMVEEYVNIYGIEHLREELKNYVFATY